MRIDTKLTRGRYLSVGAALLIALSIGLAAHRFSSPGATSAIVQSTSATEAEALVKSVGGTVTHELGIINAVGAQLTPSQLAAVKSSPGVRIY
ncbi:MAG: hypothetical protein WCC53_16025, partial [Thermoanaerobaculia bacterium]